MSRELKDGVYMDVEGEFLLVAGKYIELGPEGIEVVKVDLTKVPFEYLQTVVVSALCADYLGPL